MITPYRGTQYQKEGVVKVGICPMVCLCISSINIYNCKSTGESMNKTTKTRYQILTIYIYIIEAIINFKQSKDQKNEWTQFVFMNSTSKVLSVWRYSHSYLNTPKKLIYENEM